MAGTMRGSDRDATPVLDPTLKAELKRLAILFLVSAITMVLTIVLALGPSIDQDLIPGIAWYMVFLSAIGGWAATYLYGLYVTIRARAWGWVALCAIPVVGSVPACVAYSWIRRGELERRILKDETS